MFTVIDPVPPSEFAIAGFRMPELITVAPVKSVALVNRTIPGPTLVIPPGPVILFEKTRAPVPV